MSKKFKWDLKKLLKFKKMKADNLMVSRVSGMSHSTNNISQSDSFFFEKKMSGFTTLIENNDYSNEKNRVINSLTKNISASKEHSKRSNAKLGPEEGLILNFEKKDNSNETNIFLKELPQKSSKSIHKEDEPEKYTIKQSDYYNSPSQKLSNEVMDINLNVFSKKTSQTITSQPTSQNISQIRGNHNPITL
jgi:hypothetical protein